MRFNEWNIDWDDIEDQSRASESFLPLCYGSVRFDRRIEALSSSSEVVGIPK
jgi:hypothetical protein